MLEWFLGFVIDHGVLTTLIIIMVIGVAAWHGLAMICVGYSMSGLKSQRHGDKYEKLIADTLNIIFDIKPLRNVRLTDAVCDATEADMVLVTRKGVFSIECKYHSPSYEPRLEGSMNQKEWKVSSDSTMNNPFDQNHKHVRFLEELIEDKHVYNVVYSSAPYTFTYFGIARKSENEPFVNFFNNDKRALVYDKKHSFHKGTREFYKEYKKMDDIFTDEQVKQMTRLIESYEMDKKQRRAFAKWMRKKYQIENRNL